MDSPAAQNFIYRFDHEVAKDPALPKTYDNRTTEEIRVYAPSLADAMQKFLGLNLSGWALGFRVSQEEEIH